METKEKFLGTYQIRSIGKAEQGIHMPAGMTGHYSLYLDGKTGVVRMIPQGEKK